MRLAVAHPEIKSTYQRGIYLYARSLFSALHQNGVNTALITDTDSLLEGDLLREEICRQIAEPPRVKVRSMQVLPDVLKHRFGIYNAEAVKLDPHAKYLASNDFLAHVDELLNFPKFYDMCRLAGSKPFVPAIDVDFIAKNDRTICLTTAPVAIRSRSKSVRVIQTVHDLIALNSSAHNVNVSKFRRKLDSALNNADLIIAVSEYTRSEILDRYPGLEDRIKVVYQPLPAQEETIIHSATPAAMEDALSRHGLSQGNYVFFVGAIEERKNIARLIQAFLASDINGDSVLVFAGMLDVSYLEKNGVMEYFTKPEQRNETARNNASRIRYLGVISEIDKLCLLRGAMFFAFPTITEGFGIPIIEAQTMGCPVLTTNCSAIPEVAGKSAFLIEDATNVDEIREAINRISADDQLRNTLKTSGLENSKRFSKSNFAKTLSDVLIEAKCR